MYRVPAAPRRRVNFDWQNVILKQISRQRPVTGLRIPSSRGKPSCRSGRKSATTKFAKLPVLNLARQEERQGKSRKTALRSTLIKHILSRWGRNYPIMSALRIAKFRSFAISIISARLTMSRLGTVLLQAHSFDEGQIAETRFQNFVIAAHSTVEIKA